MSDSEQCYEENGAATREGLPRFVCGGMTWESRSEGGAEAES